MQGRGRRRAWIVAVAWLVALAASFLVDRWVHREVARGYAATTGYESWRFGIFPRASAPLLEEVFLLLRTMGHAYFAILATTTLIVFQPGRVRQAALVWLAIGLGALISQGILRPAVGKFRPGAPLTATQAEQVRERFGADAVVTYTRSSGKVSYHNSGLPLFTASLGRGARGFPSGHATLAFALFTALAFFLPRGRTLFLLLAGGVALSRVVMGEHFVSDVVAGGGIGYVAAVLVTSWPRLRTWAGPPAAT
jgi:membrane-associated phospholipid phosphatase